MPGEGQSDARRGPRGNGVAFVREVAVILISALMMSLVVKTFLAQAFVIPSASMRDTLREGDRVLVNKLVRGLVDLRRGDVVVFSDPGGWLPDGEATPTNAVQAALIAVGLLPQPSEDHLIKRVIALPGDRVVSSGRGDPLTVNGVGIDESSYTAPGSSPSSVAFDVVVPEGSLWVMGDNRQQSSDSTYHLLDAGGGAIPVDTVVGRAFLTVWPADRLGVLDRHADVYADVPEAQR